MNLAEALLEHAQLALHEPMKKHTTYRIGGEADYYIKPNTTLDLMEVLVLLQKENIPYLVLGKGSNVLISDAPFHGAVLSLDNSHKQYSFDDRQGILCAQAGCSLIALARQAMKHSLSGLEFASGIPGSVGGGLYMNAGAYNCDLASILIDVTILQNGRLIRLNKEELDYKYRHSAFQDHPDWIILEARFQLRQGKREEIAALMDSRKQRRINSQPLDAFCAGSVFRNPESGGSAWEVVDQLGFRGKRRGGARVSEVHANFIVNEEGKASANDVYDLICSIQAEAKKRYGIRLIPEVERINWHEVSEES